MTEKIDDHFISRATEFRYGYVLTVDTVAGTTSPQELWDTAGIKFNLEDFNKVKSTSMIAEQRMTKENEKSIKIEDFLKLQIKGSRRYRRVMETVRTGKIRVESNRSVKKYLQLTDTVGTPPHRLQPMMSAWTDHSMSVREKVFLLKYYNNTLGLNSRVSHFNNEVSPECSFCILRNLRPAPCETLVHL